MSKRRNPKKEKEQRNKAYARKFRKRTTTGRFSKNRRSPMGGRSGDNFSDNAEEDMEKME
ncbi:MAG TPA: hypothetical protein DCY88_21505 [Cyanobacteria bacterium UBA11372]|nr:hypothetical protein [Cyanobacteria bacterium UBA11372]